MTDADDDDENEEALNVEGDDPYSAVNGLQVSERPVNLVMPRVSENAPDSPLSDFQPACKIDGVSSKDRAGGADNEQYDVHVQVENSLRQPAWHGDLAVHDDRERRKLGDVRLVSLWCVWHKSLGAFGHWFLQDATKRRCAVDNHIDNLMWSECDDLFWGEWVK